MLAKIESSKSKDALIDEKDQREDKKEVAKVALAMFSIMIEPQSPADFLDQ